MNLSFEFYTEAINLDLDLLFQIDSTNFPTPWDQVSWQNLFQNSQRCLGIAKINNETVGFILFDLNVVDSFGHLLKIITISSFKNQGIGSGLLKYGLKYLKEEKGIKDFFLEVEASNLSAINLYKKENFKIIHTKKNFYGQDRDAFIMTLSLIAQI